MLLNDNNDNNTSTLLHTDAVIVQKVFMSINKEVNQRRVVDDVITQVQLNAEQKLKQKRCPKR